MKKLLVVVMLVSIAGVAVWKWRSGGQTATTNDAQLVSDRVWIDHIPRNDKDVIQFFATISDQSLGIFQATSQWRGQHELFRYEQSGDELRILYPQTNDREKVKVNAKKCTENRMDYCLELSGASRGVKKYYSREGWEIGQAHDAESVRLRAEAIANSLAPATTE